MLDLIFKAEEFIGDRVQIETDRMDVFIGKLINVAQAGALVKVLIEVESIDAPPRRAVYVLKDIVKI